MRDGKRPTPIEPDRTLVKRGAIRASLPEGEGIPGGRTLRGPGEIAATKPKHAPVEPAPGKIAAHRFGLSAESIAATLLLAKGYRILARRWRSPVGEIDIIARSRTTLVFVEVKARDRLDDAAEAVLLRQRRRIADAAAAWLARRPDLAELAMRFDVVLVAPGRLPRHVTGAFDIDG